MSEFLIQEKCLMCGPSSEEGRGFCSQKCKDEWFGFINKSKPETRVPRTAINDIEAKKPGTGVSDFFEAANKVKRDSLDIANQLEDLNNLKEDK